MTSQAGWLLEAIKKVREECLDQLCPPEVTFPASSQQVIPFALVRGTRGYIEMIVHQINGCYEHAAYDACAVMIRRLIETLIIEAFESQGVASKIRTTSGAYHYLGDLVSSILEETSWNLSRNAKNCFPKLKTIGDQSAHSRRFVAVRRDIDQVTSCLRTVVQELVFLAGFK